jgi:plastocyanin
MFSGPLALHSIQMSVGTEHPPMNTRDNPASDVLPTSCRHRPRRIRGTVVVLLLGAVVSLAACSSSSASGGSASHSDAISIQNFAFSPSSTTVAPGATVTVTNKDQVAHTLTATKGGFNTGDIPPGHSKTFTAPNTPGTYPYMCSIHQYMTGMLIVS